MSIHECPFFCAGCHSVIEDPDAATGHAPLPSSGRVKMVHVVHRDARCRRRYWVNHPNYFLQPPGEEEDYLSLKELEELGIGVVSYGDERGWARVLVPGGDGETGEFAA